MTMNLFEFAPSPGNPCESLGPGVMLLHSFALAEENALMSELNSVVANAPFRHMVTPGGHRMSVAMNNCGSLGWITDQAGYRYGSIDPESGAPWPLMPESFSRLATLAARAAGFENFSPDACLINRYKPGAKMSLHQDRKRA